ncbi:hypothetical protein KKH13_05095 [Patescibacteria group bacterium]|nr:hypothetical protein [Patescibacteria group bacterium]
MKENELVTVYYEIEADDMQKACHDLAVGQSIGNPSIRTKYDRRLKHMIPEYTWAVSTAIFGFPRSNFGASPNISYILSVLMGGQMDIDSIRSCRLTYVDWDMFGSIFLGPRYGIKGIRKMLKVEKRPLIGGIIKPKIGLTIPQLCDTVKQMADGGIDFIKEDEILNWQEWCEMDERVDAVMKVLEGYHTIYAPCVTSDDFRFPSSHVKAVHANIWCGFGYFQIIRRHVPYAPAIFFQKSGDKVMTTGPYSISYRVICALINRIGCDFAHVGMYGGYLSENEWIIKDRIKTLRTTIPSFSCGAKPKHVSQLVSKFGPDIMITSGGYINGHRKGITYAVKEFIHEAIQAV